MYRLNISVCLAVLILLTAGLANAQFGPTGTTNLGLKVGAEASLQITTKDTELKTSGITFGSDYTGSTLFTYKIRTTHGSGTGAINLAVTSDFDPAGGPSVAKPPTAEDALSYITTNDGGVGTAANGKAQYQVNTKVIDFGANAKSKKAGDAGEVAWTLTNDPLYATGSYTAVVTFTISAT